MLSKVWWIWVKILSVIGRKVVHLVVLGPVVFCLVTCWISGFLFALYWPRDQQVVCLVVFGQDSVCLVILGQVVKSVKWLWVKRLWVLWLSVCLCSFKRFSVWNVGLSE